MIESDDSRQESADREVPDSHRAQGPNRCRYSAEVTKPVTIPRGGQNSSLAAIVLRVTGVI